MEALVKSRTLKLISSNIHPYALLTLIKIDVSNVPLKPGTSMHASSDK